MNKAIKIGDAHDVVVIISLNIDGLRFLCDALPPKDGFTKELCDVLRSVETEAEAVRDD
jgi:hypothetical protein